MSSQLAEGVFLINARCQEIHWSWSGQLILADGNISASLFRFDQNAPYRARRTTGMMPSRTTTKRVACLGWGSLLWEPRELPVQAWQNDGPFLPLEFSRVSQDGRVTLVIDATGRSVPSLWTLLVTEDLESGIAQLAARKGVERLGAIGRWPCDETSPTQGIVEAWAKEKGLDGVVWTALKPGFPGARGKRPSLDDILGHVGKLEGVNRKRAAEYVRRAPAQIATEWRKAIGQALDGG